MQLLPTLCALVQRVNTETGLHRALDQAANLFPDYRGKEFIAYVKSDAYSFETWKYFCDSFSKYLAGNRWELKWDSSDWFCNQACEDRIHPVCIGSSTYAGPVCYEF